jgi:hypothetical protein
VVVNGDANHPGIRVVDVTAGTIGPQLTDYPDTSGGGSVNYPAWSPQGDKIAFMQRLPGAASNDFDIVVMDRATGTEVNLTRSAATRDEDPDWQPAAAPIDATAPTVPTMTKPTVAFQKAASFAVAWSSTDGGVAVGGLNPGTHHVRYRSASNTNATLLPHTWWQRSTKLRSATFTGTRGLAYCFSAMARDGSGNASAWGAERCTAVPLDDTRMAPSAGWTRVASGASGYFDSSYSRSSTRGAALTFGTAQAKRLALLVTKSPTAGSIQVLWNGTVLAQLNLAASTTTKKSLVQLPPFASVQSGTVTVKVVSTGKPVEIDALGVSAV